MRNTVISKIESTFSGNSSQNLVLDTSHLSKPFRVDRITIPDEVARDFLVTDIKVGKNSQLYSVGALPALVFSKSSRIVQPELDLIQEGQFLTVSVTCQSTGDRHFTATVEGHQVSPHEDLLRPMRRLVLGFGSTAVEPRRSACINVQPQCPFRPDQLMVSSDLARHFRVFDFKVGKNSQTVLLDGLVAVSGSVAAEYFTETSDRLPVKMDKAQTSMFMTITVTNVSDVSRNFQCAVAGEGLVKSEEVDFWTPFKRSLIATRLLGVIQDDLTLDRYGKLDRPTVADVVLVLNAPAEALDARREFFYRVLTGEAPAPSGVELILE